MRRLIKLTLVLLVASVLVAACGPDGTGSPVEVRVTLTEFKIESSLTEFQTGVPYHFVVTNSGVIPHEVLIIPPMMHEMSMDQLHETSLAGIHEDDLQAGATAEMDVTFTEPAKLELSCHTPGHYEAGMKSDILVK